MIIKHDAFDYFFNSIDTVSKKLFMDDFIESHFNYSLEIKNGELELLIEMPGLDQTKISLEVSGENLNVSAKGHVDRYRLPENIDKDTIKATMTNGLLKVTAKSKKEKSDHRIINIT